MIKVHSHMLHMTSQTILVANQIFQVDLPGDPSGLLDAPSGLSDASDCFSDKASGVGYSKWPSTL